MRSKERCSKRRIQNSYIVYAMEIHGTLFREKVLDHEFQRMLFKKKNSEQFYEWKAECSMRFIAGKAAAL